MAAVRAPTALGTATAAASVPLPPPASVPLTLPPPGPLPLPPPAAVTADDFEDQSGYGMKYKAFARFLPNLKTLVRDEPKEPKSKEPKAKDDDKKVERFDNIPDATFKEKVSEVTDKFKGKEGAGKKRDIVQKAAKEFWNSHLGEKINYKELKEELEAVVPI
jgi:hypothetical protein